VHVQVAKIERADRKTTLGSINKLRAKVTETPLSTNAFWSASDGVILSSALLGLLNPTANVGMKAPLPFKCNLQLALQVFLMITNAVGGFPDSQDPFSLGPSSIPSNGNPLCRLVLFQNAALNQYSRTLNFSYSPPTCLPSAPPVKIILEVAGRVKGVQYDRAGALWLGGVELLRTTTPEPTESGVQWSVERDVSTYRPYLNKPPIFHFRFRTM
jgi:hypothetical protein